jgi:hypothetical protein
VPRKYDPEEILDLYRRHGDAMKVSAITGAHKSTVNRTVSSEVGPRRRYLTEEQCERAVAMFEQGKCDREVAEALSTPEDPVVRERIGKFRRRRKIPANPDPRANPGRYRKYDRDEVRDMFVIRKMTIQQVAHVLDCEVEDVYYLRQKIGVAKRHPANGLKPLAERLRDAEAMLDEGASFAEIERTVHISGKVLKNHFPGRQWTNKQALEHALQVRYGEQRINRAWSAAGRTQPLTKPPLSN